MQLHPIDGNKALTDLVERVQQTQGRVTLTLGGVPLAVILTAADLAALLEELDGLEMTVDLMSDPGALADLEAYRAGEDQGEDVTGDEIRARYLPEALRKIS